MGFLFDNCDVFSHTDEMLHQSRPFSCGDEDLEFGGKGIGTELMDFIKSWMLDPSNKTACRYLTVDAYNNGRTFKFYEANGFKPIFSSNNQEKEYIGLPPEKDLKTRFMYFDLMMT
jgi:ribosomal protein S18 acetylase RimI-like enzyme